MNIDSIFNFILTYNNSLFSIFGSVVSIATIITKFTPTTKDDEILNKLISFISNFSIVNTKKDQEILNEIKKNY